MMRRALGIALQAAWAAPLYAAHPCTTDDTGTHGAGNWQLALMAERHRDGRTADAGGRVVRQVRTLKLLNPVLTYGVLETVVA